MGKGKPRHNPNKRANQRGGWCSHCERHGDELWCNYEGKSGAEITYSFMETKTYICKGE